MTGTDWIIGGVILLIIAIIYFKYYKKEKFSSYSYGGMQELGLVSNTMRPLYGGRYWWYTRPWYHDRMTSEECIPLCKKDCKKKCMLGCQSHIINAY